MRSLFKIVFATLFSFIWQEGFSQTRHALLIGINDYYEAKGVKSKESLRGPVNDAHAMRDLLINKFGYKSSDIDTLFNADATRDNIISALQKKVKQCKPGDIMLFYYSGHGVWMQNTELENDPVKRGMSQAMLTSDLYNFKNNLKCFVRDVTLKEYFNLFIDKKVVLTALLDCCFSGNLSMAGSDMVQTGYIKEKSVDFYDLMGRLTENVTDLDTYMDSITDKSLVTPPGCKLNAAGEVENKADADGDGIPDCKDIQPHTPMECFPVNAQGFGKCAVELQVQKALDRLDASEIRKVKGTNNEISTRSFDVNSTLRISERDTVVRPVDRKNSKYVFIAATTDWQKGLEFADQDKIIHGLFTAAILRVFRANPANLTIEELFQKLKKDMEGATNNQTPTLYADPGRLKGNLLGSVK